MSKKNKHNGYRIVIVPEDGRESTTLSMSALKFNSLLALIGLVVVLFITSVVMWGKTAGDRQQLRKLQSEFEAVNEQASRVAKVEQNIVEMDRYIRYIRLAMSLYGDEQPPALEDFLANDSLRKSYELSATGEDFTKIPNIVPVIDGWLSKEFSPKDKHMGVDYVVSGKGKIIRAPAKGQVVDNSVDEYLGKVVTIDHGNGFVTRFAHCETIEVSVGDVVERGQTIATVGNTGKSSTGPHLHYEIRKDGVPVDPKDYLIER